MAKYSVELARLVRETVVVEVEAASWDDAQESASEAYAAYEDDNWEPDFEWGAEEGTHVVLAEVD